MRQFLEARETVHSGCYADGIIERQSKAILAWHLGRRSRQDTEIFIEKLNEATLGRFQLTTDGMLAYPHAVSMNLGTRVDYAQLIKVYSASQEETRYSPARLQGTIIESWIGRPDRDMICTSHVERVNLTVRMRMRRLTRLTNAFSRKWENLKAAVALFVFSITSARFIVRSVALRQWKPNVNMNTQMRPRPDWRGQGFTQLGSRPL